jgi:hypothetical protein
MTQKIEDGNEGIVYNLRVILKAQKGDIETLETCKIQNIEVLDEGIVIILRVILQLKGRHLHFYAMQLCD